MPILYASTIPDYTLGQIINMEEWNGISRILVAGANLPFAAPVIAGSGGEWDCAPLTAAGENVLGIARMNHVLYHTGDYYAPGDTVSVITAGVVAVNLGANVTEGAQARFNVTNGTWTGAAASATVLTIPGAQFEYAGSSGAIGVVRYQRPIPSVSVGA
jgi:hypothetical protein